MQSVCLINPPRDRGVKQWATVYPPMGLMGIAACLEERGHSVRIIDCMVDQWDHEDLRKYLLKNNFDVIGIHVLSALRFSAFKCAEIAKGINPNCKTFVGGSHVSFMAKEVLQHYPSIDVVVRGEGEVTVTELLNSHNLKTVKGITYRDKSRIRSNPDKPYIKDLDSLPFHAWHLVPMEKYFEAAEKNELHLRHPATGLMTARGCYNKCTFCASPALWSMTRRFSPSYIASEIELLQDKYGVKDLFFFDDTFSSTPWIKEFYKEIVNRKIDITFNCMSRVNTANKEFISLMKKAGCYLIAYGVESGSPKVLKRIGKNITIQQVKDAITNTREAGIFAKAFFMIGFPVEGIPHIQQTRDLILSLELDDFAIAVTMLYPGTELCNECGIKNEFWFNPNEDGYTTGHSNPVIPTYPHPVFSRAELDNMANLINYEADKKHFWRRVRFKSALEHKNIARAFFEALLRMILIRRKLKPTQLDNKRSLSLL